MHCRVVSCSIGARKVPLKTFAIGLEYAIQEAIGCVLMIFCVQMESPER